MRKTYSIMPQNIRIAADQRHMNHRTVLHHFSPGNALGRHDLILGTGHTAVRLNEQAVIGQDQRRIPIGIIDETRYRLLVGRRLQRTK